MTPMPFPFHGLYRHGCMLAMLLLPMGCAGPATDAALYLLPVPTAATATAASDAAPLVLEDVRLAAFLDGAGLVLQTSDVNLHAARNHRWAEALARQLQRNLRQGLQQQLGILVVEAPGRAGSDSLQLSVDVDAFHGERNGSARVAGRWLLQQQGKVVASANFEQHVTLAADGYPALVRALGQGWSEVIDAIAAGIAAVPGNNLGQL